MSLSQLEKKDKNGYVPSILPTESGVDFVLKELYGYDELKASCETVRHEIFYGYGNRELSKANGFWVNISPEIHAQIHNGSKMGRDIDTFLKAVCEEEYLKTHTQTEFTRLMRKNYL